MQDNRGEASKEKLLNEREFLISQVNAARERGNEREAQRWLGKCEEVNVHLRAMGHVDVSAEVAVELPLTQVSSG